MAAVTARWRDLRLEAWRTLPPGSDLDRAYPLPFATAPMTIQSGRLVGAVRVDQTRNVSEWLLSRPRCVPVMLAAADHIERSAYGR